MILILMSGITYLRLVWLKIIISETIYIRGSQNIPKGRSNSLVENKLTTSWQKKNKTKSQTTAYKIPHRKLRNERY